MRPLVHKTAWKSWALAVYEYPATLPRSFTAAPSALTPPSVPRSIILPFDHKTAWTSPAVVEE